MIYYNGTLVTSPRNKPLTSLLATGQSSSACKMRDSYLRVIAILKLELSVNFLYVCSWQEVPTTDGWHSTCRKFCGNSVWRIKMCLQEIWLAAVIWFCVAVGRVKWPSLWASAVNGWLQQKIRGNINFSTMFLPHRSSSLLLYVAH